VLFSKKPCVNHAPGCMRRSTSKSSSVIRAFSIYSPHSPCPFSSPDPLWTATASSVRRHQTAFSLSAWRKSAVPPQ
jgi:hypothetical protein